MIEPKVYLVGAGPGDPKLLTLRGKELLEAADVVIYDYLASEHLLKLIKPEARQIYVGKISGNHALKQEEINELLCDEALRNQVVVRLKGGDPYVFGRGGEEAEALAKAGFSFEEVPGISSTIAGAAYAGIPLTHRSYASSVTIITGHEDADKKKSVLNWHALANSASTLVFVMGMKNLPNISNELIKAGLSPQTPSALVHWATTSKQRSITASLEDLPQVAVENDFTNPSIIIVGEVVKLREKLNWFENKPLFGKNIVVTRSRAQASELSEKLEAFGAQTIIAPTIRIQSLKEDAQIVKAITEVEAYDWIIFTSVNGVKAFFEKIHELGYDSRILSKNKFACIGSATAVELLKYGIKADLVPEKYIAEDIIDSMLAIGIEGKKILIPRAKQAREVLPEELERNGAEVNVVAVYETLPIFENKDTFLEKLKQGEIDCISFASSSTVDNFFAHVPEHLFLGNSKVRFACIGPVTRKSLEKYGLACSIEPKNYTIEDLSSAIVDYYIHG